jgi:ubiquinone biosynthesis protein
VRVVVATDRSQTAQKAVAFAADLASRFESELVLLQVMHAPAADGDAELARAERRLLDDARAAAGERGRARVAVAADIARGIVDAAHAEDADVLVVGNAGMGGRKAFLLANIPNRVSHSARCTVIIVNTTGQVIEAPPETDGARRPRLVGRAAHIGKVVAKYGLEEARDPARRTHEALRERARRVRAALEELGPTFAKLGQILSTRPDLIPQEFVDELATLQDRVPPLTEEQVVNVMEQELATPWEDVFESIEPEPLAAGTIGQVHRATLESGDRVVVKVQRPNAREEIFHDLGLLELFAEKAMARPGLREVIDIPALVQHLSESLRRELDFALEASNIERMREVLAPYNRLDAPRVYADLSTPRLLVMEEVGGGPLASAPEGEARREAASQLLEAYYRQILTVGFFHADPHPGNLKWWNDKVYFLDFGMVGEVGPELRELMVLLLLAFFRDDPRFLTDVMLMLAGGDTPPGLDFDELEREFAAYIGRFGGLTTLKDIQLGPMIEGMTEIAARHRIRLPAALALSGKAFGQMQLAVGELDPTLEPFSVMVRFLMRSIAERAREGLDPQALYYEGLKLKLRLTRFADAVERAAGARPGAPLRVDFRGSTEIEAAIHRVGQRLLLAGGAGVAVAATGAVWLAGRRR